ncbi:Splicing factor [Komagataella phaffii CBS 7435]|uniref:Splicing factor that reanneals U4 and U6 snRNPs during spliceosome recycling n=2 Tax=Komagataella phaffii TaxID=460519 RepID=C4QV54_KOMPG|nr:Splicing factor that reanneals U4 and U6 snRNPs during spliceosome recycling [Komagataella phaffii GS115]AOA60967.1 GQ67_02323T0 [Komagataella phaffii]CAH2445779.1 Splicing factor [Komagataella phaffii CBS 7435]AOA65836.1 GQ68_02924T0 [Komagataella phaffii GS115]CAY67124.1 Splicing factor that reanneals U4 and U6 snRNPs during spliceosome recycling [Komagataella phaffii GS115]CCA36237.1 Splicing factor [Komagataella phaffii CBS 7435]
MEQNTIIPRGEYLQLIENAKGDEPESVLDLRLKFLSIYKFTTQEWNSWLQEMQTENFETVDFYFQLRLKDDSSPSVWLKYIELASNYSTLEEKVTEIFNKALISTQYHYTESQIIWSSYWKFMSEQQNVGADVLDSIYLQRLQIPHFDSQETFNHYSVFVTNNFKEAYDSKMKYASKLFNQSKAISDRLEDFELKLLDAQFQPTSKFWIGYIDSVFRLKKFQHARLLAKSIFERATTNRFDVLAIDIWSHYFNVLNEKDIALHPSSVESFIRQFPEHPTPYQYYFSLTLDARSLLKFRSQAFQFDIFTPSKFLEWKNTACSLLWTELDVLLNSDSSSIPILQDLSMFSELALQNDDVLHSLDRSCVEIYSLLDLLDEARALLRKMTEKFPSQVEIWLFSYQFERSHDNLTTASKILRAGISRWDQLDWPQRLMDEQSRFEGIYNHKDLAKAFAKSSRKLQESSEPMASPSIQSELELENNEEKSGPPKRALEESIYTPSKKSKRDRENLSVLVTSGNKLEELSVRNLFQDCGEIKSVFLRNNLATIEFSTEDGYLAALTKDHKTIDGFEISVNKLLSSTVWVTNFPPDQLSQSLEDLFSEVGTVLNTRFPSLRFNTDRRFCYIQFTSEQAAMDAVAKFNGKVLKDSQGKEYHLVAKISNPEKRSQRSDEGRELFIRNLDFKLTKEDLVPLFEKYGQIDKIYVPCDSETKKNNGFAFITFKEKDAAESALELNSVPLLDRPLDVSLAKKKPKKVSVLEMNPAPKKNSKLTTIEAFDLPETVNSSQLMKIFSAIGPISKITLKPESHSAFIAYEDVNNSGRAMLVLNGKQVDGFTLKLSEKSTQQQPRKPSQFPTSFIPPSLQRRKV